MYAYPEPNKRTVGAYGKRITMKDSLDQETIMHWIKGEIDR